VRLVIAPVTSIGARLELNHPPLGDIEGPIDKSLGTKEALAVRLRKLAIDGEKTLQGTCVPAELPGVVLSAFEHRLDRTARTYLSFIGAPESDRLP